MNSTVPESTSLSPLPEADHFGDAILLMAAELARHSDAATGLTCAYLTPAHRSVAAQIEHWMGAAGLNAAIDAAGNVVGRLECPHPGAKTLITGSHYDTVRNGGHFDGRLGILLPLAIAAYLKRSAIELPYHLEIIGFAEEEGLRFRTSFLGSSVIAGKFDPRVLELTDAQGIRLGDAIDATGARSAELTTLGREAESISAFVEVHIEQGPVLLQAGLPVGVVSSIAGSARYQIDVRGVASHAGTTPMNMRRDAAAAVAEMILYIEKRCGEAPTLVGTVGQLEVPAGSVNVIPGQCRFSIDIRAATDPIRDAAQADVLEMIGTIAQRRGVEVAIQKLMEVPSVPCATRLMDLLTASVRRSGTPVHNLPSGAGHDAMMMAKLADVAMLFVRCGNGGISHNPLETMTAEDADLAARIMLDFFTHYSTP